MIDFINGWRELIIATWKEHGLAAALVTIITVAALLVLEQHRPGHRRTHVALGLLLWAVTVPLLGLVLDALAKVLGYIEAIICKSYDLI